jgi:hypothetical protein
MRLRAWLCGFLLFVLVFLPGSFRKIWWLGPERWVHDKGGLGNLWDWLAGLMRYPSEKWSAHPENIRSCAILLAASIVLGAIGFWLGRGRRRDELVADYKDGRFGIEKDGRLGPENPD